MESQSKKVERTRSAEELAADYQAGGARLDALSADDRVVAMDYIYLKENAEAIKIRDESIPADQLKFERAGFPNLKRSVRNPRRVKPAKVEPMKRHPPEADAFLKRFRHPYLPDPEYTPQSLPTGNFRMPPLEDDEAFPEHKKGFLEGTPIGLIAETSGGTIKGVGSMVYNWGIAVGEELGPVDPMTKQRDFTRGKIADKFRSVGKFFKDVHEGDREKQILGLYMMAQDMKQLAMIHTPEGREMWKKGPKLAKDIVVDYVQDWKDLGKDPGKFGREHPYLLAFMAADVGALGTGVAKQVAKRVGKEAFFKIMDEAGLAAVQKVSQQVDDTIRYHKKFHGIEMTTDDAIDFILDNDPEAFTFMRRKRFGHSDAPMVLDDTGKPLWPGPAGSQDGAWSRIGQRMGLSKIHTGTLAGAAAWHEWRHMRNLLNSMTARMQDNFVSKLQKLPLEARNELMTLMRGVHNAPPQAFSRAEKELVKVAGDAQKLPDEKTFGGMVRYGEVRVPDDIHKMSKADRRKWFLENRQGLEVAPGVFIGKYSTRKGGYVAANYYKILDYDEYLRKYERFVDKYGDEGREAIEMLLAKQEPSILTIEGGATTPLARDVARKHHDLPGYGQTADDLDARLKARKVYGDRAGPLQHFRMAFIPEQDIIIGPGPDTGPLSGIRNWFREFVAPTQIRNEGNVTKALMEGRATADILDQSMKYSADLMRRDVQKDFYGQVLNWITKPLTDDEMKLWKQRKVIEGWHVIDPMNLPDSQKALHEALGYAGPGGGPVKIPARYAKDMGMLNGSTQKLLDFMFPSPEARKRWDMFSGGVDAMLSRPMMWLLGSPSASWRNAFGQGEMYLPYLLSEIYDGLYQTIFGAMGMIPGLENLAKARTSTTPFSGIATVVPAMKNAWGKKGKALHSTFTLGENLAPAVRGSHHTPISGMGVKLFGFNMWDTKFKRQIRENFLLSYTREKYYSLKRRGKLPKPISKKGDISIDEFERRFVRGRIPAEVDMAMYRWTEIAGGFDYSSGNIVGQALRQQKLGRAAFPYSTFAFKKIGTHHRRLGGGLNLFGAAESAKTALIGDRKVRDFFKGAAAYYDSVLTDPALRPKHISELVADVTEVFSGGTATPRERVRSLANLSAGVTMNALAWQAATEAGGMYHSMKSGNLGQKELVQWMQETEKSLGHKITEGEVPYGVSRFGRFRFNSLEALAKNLDLIEDESELWSRNLDHVHFGEVSAAKYLFGGEIGFIDFLNMQISQGPLLEFTKVLQGVHNSFTKSDMHTRPGERLMNVFNSWVYPMTHERNMFARLIDPTKRDFRAFPGEHSDAAIFWAKLRYETPGLSLTLPDEPGKLGSPRYVPSTDEVEKFSRFKTLATYWLANIGEHSPEERNLEIADMMRQRLRDSNQRMSEAEMTAMRRSVSLTEKNGTAREKVLAREYRDETNRIADVYKNSSMRSEIAATNLRTLNLERAIHVTFREEGSWAAAKAAAKNFMAEEKKRLKENFKEGTLAYEIRNTELKVTWQASLADIEEVTKKEEYGPNITFVDSMPARQRQQLLKDAMGISNQREADWWEDWNDKLFTKGKILLDEEHTQRYLDDVESNLIPRARNDWERLGAELEEISNPPITEEEAIHIRGKARGRKNQTKNMKFKLGEVGIDQTAAYMIHKDYITMLGRDDYQPLTQKSERFRILDSAGAALRKSMKSKVGTHPLGVQRALFQLSIVSSGGLARDHGDLLEAIDQRDYMHAARIFNNLENQKMGIERFDFIYNNIISALTSRTLPEPGSGVWE